MPEIGVSSSASQRFFDISESMLELLMEAMLREPQNTRMFAGIRSLQHIAAMYIILALRHPEYAQALLNELPQEILQENSSASDQFVRDYPIAQPA